MAYFDPYVTLGVARNAVPPVIKAAYRAAVQTAHPDRGGDPAAFIVIVKAFDLLSDPEARRLYDEAGIVDEDAVKAFRRDVAKILADMFDAAVSTAVATGIDLKRVDFVQQMTQAVRTGMADAKTALTRADRDIVALGSLGARIKRDGEGHNIFGERTEEQAGLRRRVLLMETAIVELGNYRSEVELISALEGAAAATPAASP
jgi:curved DNA-binding protein CbpA